MAELNKVFIQNVSTIAINDLLENDLITLEYDLTKREKFGGLKAIQYDGINLWTVFHILPSMQIHLQVNGRKRQDLPYDKSEFYVTGYLQRRTTKYIMDMPYFDSSPNQNPFHKINTNKDDVEMNSWIEKYKQINIEPNGYAKSGEYVLY